MMDSAATIECMVEEDPSNLPTPQTVNNKASSCRVLLGMLFGVFVACLIVLVAIYEK
jgi:hypothetical protein